MSLAPARTLRRLLLAFAFVGVLHAPAAARATPWPHDPNVVVKRVLAQPDYRVPATTASEPQPDVWGMFWQWVRDGLAKLLHPIVGALQKSARVGTVLGVILTIASLLALVYVIARLALAFAAPRRRAASGFSESALQERRSAAQWRAVAAEAAARGDFARAVAALFGAALATLDESGVVPFDGSRTPGEYRRLVRGARAGAAPPFDALTECFVRAAYSGAPVQRVDFEGAARALHALDPLVAA